MCCGICVLEHIFNIVTTILLMVDSLFRMLLYNLYAIFSVFCQICSVLPLCIVFIITSKLKCFICNRSNICCVGGQGQCPILRLLSSLILLYFIFYAFGALDSIFKVMGYVKDTDTSKISADVKNMTNVNDSKTYSDTNTYDKSNNLSLPKVLRYDDNNDSVDDDDDDDDDFSVDDKDKINGTVVRYKVIVEDDIIKTENNFQRHGKEETKTISETGLQV